MDDLEKSLVRSMDNLKQEKFTDLIEMVRNSWSDKLFNQVNEKFHVVSGVILVEPGIGEGEDALARVENVEQALRKAGLLALE